MGFLSSAKSLRQRQIPEARMIRLGIAVYCMILLAASSAEGLDCAFRLREKDLARLPAKLSEAEIGAYGAAYVKERIGLIKEGPMADRVKRITSRLLPVVRKRPEVVYTVEVLDTGVKGACAYPGGFVFLTRGLVELAQNDDELAIVIAHELAHIAIGQTDRPIEQELPPRVEKRLVEIGAAGRGFAAEIAARLCEEVKGKREVGTVIVTAQEIRKEKELQADETGIVYASIAGYDASTVYSLLDRLVTNGPSPCHPSKEERKRRIAQHVQGIVDRLHLFDAGIGYFMRRDYEIVLDAFRNFLSVYPSPEVHHNLGLTYHRLALSHFEPPQRKKTKCSAALETTSAAERLRLRGAADRLSENRERFEELLNQAVDHYKKAIEMNPASWPAYANLGCALLDQGKNTFAQAHLEEALKANPRHAMAQNNLGVVFLLAGARDRGVARLEEAARLDAGYADPHFNLAQAWSLRGDKKRSRAALQRYVKLASQRSSPYVQMAREQLGLAQEKRAAGGGRADRASSSLPIRPGQDAKSLALPDRELTLLLNRRIHARVYESIGLTVLLRDSRVDQVSVNGRSKQRTAEGIGIGSDAKQIVAQYGDPDRVEETGSGKYLVYEDLRLVFALREAKVTSWFVYR